MLAGDIDQVLGHRPEQGLGHRNAVDGHTTPTVAGDGPIDDQFRAHFYASPLQGFLDLRGQALSGIEYRGDAGPILACANHLRLDARAQDQP